MVADPIGLPAFARGRERSAARYEACGMEITPFQDASGFPIAPSKTVSGDGRPHVFARDPQTSEISIVQMAAIRLG
jgi:hypothetical protein